MSKAKGSYSLISVEVAPDEEVVRVDANGVHHESPSESSRPASSFSDASAETDSAPELSPHAAHAAAATETEAVAGETHGNKATGRNRAETESDSYDGRDDLEGPVPMANMQRIIIAAVVVCLIAFIAYFAVVHG